MSNLAFAMPGPTETLVVLGVLVLMFGAKKLPKLAYGVGNSLTQFKRGLRDADGEIAEAIEEAKKQ